MAPARHRFVTIAFVAAVLFGSSAMAAAQVVLADLNGDGVRDRVEASRAGTEVVVRTSAGHRAQRLRAPDRIVRLIVGDINRDGHADIVVTTRRSGLYIWLNSGHGRFRSARLPRAPGSDWRPARSAGDAPISSATDDNVFASSMAPLPAMRARAPTPDPAFRSLPRHQHPSVERYTRPRVPRGPPLSPGLI
jgi:hypothetical protein